MAREFTEASPPCQCGFVYGCMTRIYATDDLNLRPHFRGDQSRFSCYGSYSSLLPRFCKLRKTAVTNASISLPLRSG